MFKNHKNNKKKKPTYGRCRECVLSGDPQQHKSGTMREKAGTGGLATRAGEAGRSWEERGEEEGHEQTRRRKEKRKRKRKKKEKRRKKEQKTKKRPREAEREKKEDVANVSASDAEWD